ncbi:unnamed protein product [Calypogeia fissa]
MLLEMALAEFSDERDWNVWSGSSSPDPGESPVDSTTRQIYHSPYERAGNRSDWGRYNDSNNGAELKSSSISISRRLQQPVSVGVEEEEQRPRKSRSHIQVVSVARRHEPALNRSESKDTFHWEEAVASVPFEWEDSPGKSRMVQESRSFGRSSHPEPLPLPPALRPISVGSPRSFLSIGSPIRGPGSPIKSGSGNGIGGKVKSILSGRGLTSNVKEEVKEDKYASLPERNPLPAERGPPDFAGRRREDVDRAQSDSSDDGEGTSPVSTLDLPVSPLTPSYSPQQGPQLGGHESVIRRQLAQSRPMPTSHWTNSIMSEELPAVMEEDEEDVESVYGYHTMEFQTLDSSPSTSEDHRDWRMSGRDHIPSKSWSAPTSRQNSSLRPPGAQSRGRRRSDFDWPEDFEERPEEVVKEVDESLWAFSPVNSTFVFSGNENNASDSRNRSPAGPRVNGGLTPPTSSPGLSSLLDHIALRTSLVRTGASKAGKSTEVEYPKQRSSRLRQYNDNGDDNYASDPGHPMKRSYSCLPFFSLCSAQRPTAISFSQRLGPSLNSLGD